MTPAPPRNKTLPNRAILVAALLLVGLLLYTHQRNTALEAALRRLQEARSTAGVEDAAPRPPPGAASHPFKENLERRASDQLRSLRADLRQLVDENERLRLEQAALGRTNEALARSLDSRLSQTANLRKYAEDLLDYVDKIVGQLDTDTAELIRKNALVLPGDLVSIPNEHAAVFLGIGPGGSIPPGVADALQAPGSHDFTADALSRLGITNYQQLAISGVTNFTVQRPPSEARE
jgi:hypothetical protein